MSEFLYGAIVMACAVIGLHFVRFWRRTRDRLFLFFAATFWILGIDWIAVAFTQSDESSIVIYSIRLLAFVVLLVGIWDKNRK
jgi:hypothetical protein